MALGIWSKLQSLIFGSAIGAASADAIGPVLEPVKQHANIKNPYRVLDAGRVAELLAEGAVTPESAHDEASRTGYSVNRLNALVHLAQAAPDLAQALEIWNRDPSKENLVDDALAKHKVMPEYWAVIKDLRHEKLSPADVATAIHRGLIPDPGLLKGEQPGQDRTVEAYPVYPIDAIKEAQAEGYDHDRLGVLVGLAGLPMGPHEAAQAYFRGIITHDDYITALNEGNTRNEWGEAILAQTRQIPTARDFIENWLRGYIGPDEAKAGAALHGMSPEHAEIIFENSGRAMNLHQITQALAFDAHYNPTPADDPDPYHQSTLVGPLRPEYYELNEALKYTLPSAMYFRTLQTSGVLSQPEAEKWYLRLGWPPDLAKQVSIAFDKPTGTAAKKPTDTDLLTLMDGGYLTEPETLAALEALGYAPTAAQQKIDLVSARRAAGAKNTAITDLHGAFKKGDLSVPEAVDALTALGIPDPARSEIVSDWSIAFTALNPPKPPGV